MCASPPAEQWILCPQCDLMTHLPPISVGQRARCPRCHSTLFTRWRDTRIRATGYTLAALFMLILANLFPFISMQVAGFNNQITLWRIPQVMLSEDYASLAMLFLLFVQGVPALCMLTIFLLVNRVRLPLACKRLMARVLFHLKTWGMAEIFLVGVLVSFVKLMAYGDIGLGSSFLPWCLFCLLQLRAFMCIDRRMLWQEIAPLPALPAMPTPGISGLAQQLRACRCCAAVLPAQQTVCPRCHTYGTPRRRHSLQWTLALLLTSLMLYIPANLLPIMVTQALGNKITSTIMAGVVLLWGEGSYPVALVIFIASIMVPSLKMLAIGWLCWDAAGYGRRDSEKMHLIYEVVEFVGRWSMIDVFVIAILSALVRMGQLMSIYPDIGALLFALVVILTMIASMTFDSRLTWDRARYAQHNRKELKLAGE
ncbi:paraquat-inducible protein A [Erwinia sp. OLTSP20]|uniref:membrane integrity-associated transporter subunit PqiA n=1 Tax=unclassified Erwinia TaxID=2622719 RepID=UPI000C18E2AD|nr:MULTISPECIES: membrane integrity-associated transporter subunit PqiA [unclassified Erwinia]PIJ51348.1 paraquat-inducible protein A [Erwinia sp. OAMSP11]PIJ74132.1 paraquat-inducible protein A [Erwinia sp. OLSSP12]PIJ81578.1 paraquat-inducible protein A [Erwinia sp. OLCASP19]PIJ86095.1 paraquat-inducible protein A [Erwinia sp. OLMTSP26]PIJ87844.1 paraquat-inducible protein A [Erwinia sp. OLMDSP33]